jgi:[acyl-carrier-protein] S-malonyltransferase
MNAPLCVMFAGQSVQEAGMGHELLKIPEAANVIQRLTPYLGKDLEALLTSTPDDVLALTYNAQRAIHASHVAHWLAWKARHPETVLNGAIGHSMGIVAALVAAEAITLEDSALFIAARAKAFSDCCKTFSEPMGLAAVSAEDFTEVAESVTEVPGVSVALWNTIGRGTLGGTMAALEAYAQKAHDEDWPVKIKLLKVEGPYHTSAFEAAKAPLRDALSQIKISPPKVPVFMGTSGQLETDPQRIGQLLIDQTTACERHLEAVRSSHDSHCQSYLEVSFKPQPIHWLSEQVLANDLNPHPFRSFAITTENISA